MRPPGIAYVAIGATLGLAVFAASSCALSRTEHLEQRVRIADSTATVKTLEAVIWHRDKVAAEVRAHVAELHADSLTALAASLRVDVGTKIARATASRARVDTTGIQPDVAEALADADSLRLAVTPALEADAVAIIGYRRTIAELHATIALGDSAFLAQGEALRARVVQVAALEQRRAPRCGWKCGAMIGAGGALLAGAIPTLVTRFIPGAGR